MNDVSERRVALNEALFRSINESVLALEERFGSPDGGFICECADTGCSETVLLLIEEYEQIHSNPRRFFVVPGHEQPDIESVVERHANYFVVEKNIPVPQI